MLKKTPGWVATPPAVMIQEFQEHLNSLKTISRPAIEPIKPQSGKSPFLKITFISDGKKREFTRLNKTSTNNYETRSLTPLSAQPYEKEVKSKIKTMLLYTSKRRDSTSPTMILAL